MTARIDRADPPYLQVVKHIRARIESGALREGDHVPSARRIMSDWGVSMATATKVLAALRAEGLAVGVPGVGTIVTTRGTLTAPRDRVVAALGTGRVHPADEHTEIRAAELTTAPGRVADALGLPPGAPVVRRHRVTYKDGAPVSASTSWLDGALAERAPALLAAERLGRGTPGYLREAAGRAAAGPQTDQITAGRATGDDAADLGVEPGAPVLRGRNWIRDEHGTVLEYGEFVSVAGRWMTYEYEISS
ncbi:GntR family transcriptional regulator [Actinomadura macrotermitis]|uniref:Putative transcriptional regulator of 2-aminoethylphosphonate degradation operons n=1 Tax=Actinomadura macrotermitis TaxID=2585200 RepID=A0A7K0BU89_9ACTN|nr:GntR family transcriptional regulator [Actinomadura macrotermitis]MQY04697.1 putative transcriptional regulator of 2-aminoethylphosphonate degradation operons [Actinomadura macrotermitis]